MDLCDSREFYENLVTVFSEELHKKKLIFHKSIEVIHSHIFVDTTKLEQVLCGDKCNREM